MYICNIWLKFAHYAITKSLQSRDFLNDNSIQLYHDKRKIPKKEGFHQEMGLKFKE